MLPSNRTYLVGDNEVSYEEAVSFCNENGGYVAEISTAEERQDASAFLGLSIVPI